MKNMEGNLSPEIKDTSFFHIATDRSQTSYSGRSTSLTSMSELSLALPATVASNIRRI
jgi:hypothetical protein